MGSFQIGVEPPNSIDIEMNEPRSFFPFLTDLFLKTVLDKGGLVASRCGPVIMAQAIIEHGIDLIGPVKDLMDEYVVAISRAVSDFDEALVAMLPHFETLRAVPDDTPVREVRRLVARWARACHRLQEVNELASAAAGE